MSITARISRRALTHNLRVLAERSAPAKVMFVVKANGYGHGAQHVASIAYEAGIRNFGCLEIENASAIRAVVPDTDVQLLAWQFSEADDLTDVARQSIDLGVGSFDQLSMLHRAHAPGANPIQVHLKVDTGLNRNGVPQSDWVDFVARAVSLESDGVLSIVGVWTHIAETNDELDAAAHRDFESARNVLEAAVGRRLFAHLAASSASFRLPDFRFDAVRIGGHAYGIPSFDDITPAEMGLIPVMTLVGKCEPDHDDEWGAIMSVSGGFTDGIPGYAAGRVDVAIDGTRFPVKAVLEDELIVAGTTTNSTVYLFGDGNHGEQTVREWGDALGTLGDEITCRISPLVPRIVVD